MGIGSFIASLGGSGIGSALEGAGELAKDIRSAVTGELSPEARAELETKAAELDARIIEAQAKVNEAEARHSSLFVAGWRPAVGWCCASALFWQFVAAPAATWIVRLLGREVDMLALDIGPLITLLLGMLGMAGLRTLEKTQNVEGRH